MDNKDLPKIRKAARRQGWHVEATSDGEMFYAPDGRSKALWHHTPSDRNALKAFVRQLKKAASSGRRPRRRGDGMNEERYFGVSIDTWGEGPTAIDDERLGALAWALGELGAAGPAVGAGGVAGGPSATFGVYAVEELADPASVWATLAERAVSVFEDSCSKAGVSHGGIAHIEILTDEYFDREIQQDPETYLGVTEVARELGVSRQRVSELRRSETFPAPVADLAAGPVWRGSSLRRFIEGWERRPGRPRKARSPAAS